MIKDSTNIALAYRIYYKVMSTNINPKAIRHSPKNETLLIEANTKHANIQTPKLLQWNQINLPNEWILSKANEAQNVTPITQPVKTEKDEYGNVRLLFETDSNTTGFRKSVSSISRPTLSRTLSGSVLRGVDFGRNIPKPYYQSTYQNSELSLSPTHSDMRYSKQLNMIQQEIIK